MGKSMTAGELIAELQKFNPESLVFVSGCYGSTGNVDGVGVVEKEWYLGPDSEGCPCMWSDICSG